MSISIGRFIFTFFLFYIIIYLYGKKEFMSDKKVRNLVIIASIMLLFAGAILYITFDRLGLGKKTSNYVNYNVNDYIEVSPVTFNDYTDVYSSINVSRVDIKNIDESITEDFISKEEEIIGYITGYYKEMNTSTFYEPVNTVSSTIKTQINGAVLSIFYRLDFNLDASIFEDNIKTYVITTNIDLGTNKILTYDDLLSKYNYTRDYIADKVFNEDVLIDKGQVVIDKNTNISLTKSDIERKKEEYVGRIISEFDNIIDMYIESGSLVLVYDKKELKNVFFDNKFDTDVKFRYLK